MKISDLLRTARERAGFSQSLLARLSRVAQPKISAYESGRESPTAKTMVRLLEACGNDLRLSGRRISLEEMSRGAVRSLARHRRIAAALLADESSRHAMISEARGALATAREVNPFGRHWDERWSELLDGPLDDLVAGMIGEDTFSVELRANSPFVALQLGDIGQEAGSAAR